MEKFIVIPYCPEGDLMWIWGRTKLDQALSRIQNKKKAMLLA